MGEITDLMHSFDDLIRQYNAERARLVEVLAEYRAITDRQAKVASMMDRLLQALVTDSIQETEDEGGPRKRSRVSTNLDPVSVDPQTVKPKKEKQVREMSGEVVEPGSGKRGCSLCKRTGHRAKNCPNT